MKAKRLLSLLPAGAALTGTYFLVAPTALGFTIFGPALGLDQRDFRVFNNFADVSANDNTTPDPNFPGHTGATLAIWKATVEWGSTLHGDGSGDPTQPFDLGSSGANFDPSFQGLNTSAGDLDSNTHSAAFGLGAGIIAITEFGPGGGWRIRYNDDSVFDDGPGLAPSGQFDLQTIATHQYGHALGLGHTSVSGCVMSPFYSPGPSGRDLCPDDQAGMQFLYGAVPPDKPLIEAAFAGQGALVTILGQNFAPTANEVWFTQAGAGGTGDPVKLFGVVSTFGGTMIEVTLPAAAGSGDVLVRKPNSGFSSLSNAFPFNATGAFPSCGVAKYGTDAGGANVASLSSTSAAGPGGTVTLDLADFNVDGIALTIVATNNASLPLFGGTVLIDPGTIFTTLATAISSGTGTQPIGVPATPALVGAKVHGQAGQFDGGLPGGVALSNGVVISICP